MTQPDGLWPPTSSNFSSFSAFAAKTQADYEAERYGNEQDRWGGNILSPLLMLFLNPQQAIQSLQAALDSMRANLTAFISGLDGRMLTAEAKLEQLIEGTSTAVNSGGDNFNRADIGSDWTNVAGTLTIKDSAYVQTNDMAVGYFNKVSPATDKHGASVMLVNKFPGICRLIICADDAFTNYAAAEIYAGVLGNDYVRIVTGSGPNLVVSHYQANFPGFPFGSLQNGLILQMKYDPVINKYFILANGDLIIDWEDVDNLVTHGPTKRRCGILSCEDGTFAGFGITDYLNFDWT